MAAMMRTSCSVKPRVVIFHISPSNSTEVLFMRSVWNNLLRLTRSDLVIVIWEYGGCSGLYFLETEHSYFWGVESV